MKKVLIILASLVSVFLLSTFLYVEKSTDAFSSIVTFLSIIIGFCITALSIFATSNFAKELYRQEDPNDNSKTLLHNLTNSFKYCVVSSSLTILVILLFYYVGSICFLSNQYFNSLFSLKSILIGIVWYLTILSVILFFRLIDFFYSCQLLVNC